MPELACCPRCHGEVSADALEGLCPECLFQQALAGPGPGEGQEAAGRSPAPAFVPPAPAELARHFPQLEILELVGQGGMGAVYKARQPKLDRLVAVKVLPPEVARDPAFAERFMREARSLARLNHANIVTIYDFGETGGLYYFSMEFVDGKNVRQLLEAGELTVPQALAVVPQVCDALRYAHDEGVVHRDIKPENILLDRKGRVKIADFGLARIVGLSPTFLTLTGSQEVMGTLYYMAPEQMKRSHLVDHRADLYSLGVVFYEMLTGELPVGRFAPPSHKALVDARLDPIVLRALAREPEHRYQDAADLKKEVECVAAGVPAAPSARAPAVQLNLAAVRCNWPSVRFTIPHVSWTSQASGEIYRDEEALILEFKIVGVMRSSEPKEVRIPFSELTSVSCQTESCRGMPRWARHWGGLGTTEIVIKARRPSVLADLPASQHGRGRLHVHWGDRDAAKQLVDSVVRLPAAPSGRAEFNIPGGQSVDRERARMRLAGPAVGVLLAGILGLVSSVVLGMVLASKTYSDQGLSTVHLALALAAFPVAAGVVFLIAGAVRMLQLKSYLTAVTAAILAVLPWSPGWLLGLPFGIWALVVLSRREVVAAFLSARPAPSEALPAARAPRRLVRGKLVSLLQSMGGFFFTRLGGRKPLSHISSPDKTSAKGPQPRETAPYHAESLARDGAGRVEMGER